MFFDPKDPRYNHCTVKEIEHLKRIMKEKIDLSLNRSLEELIASYFEAHGAGVDIDVDSSEKEKSDYSALESYLSNLGAI